MQHPHTGSQAYNWTDAWESFDDPEISNIDKYRLPEPGSLDDGERLPATRLIKGDRFWDTEGRYQITVTDVRTKIHQGVVAPKGEKGVDSVFYTTDWDPPKQPGGFTKDYHPHRDDEPFSMRVEEFAERLAKGELVPHTGNGLPPLP